MRELRPSTNRVRKVATAGKRQDQAPAAPVKVAPAKPAPVQAAKPAPASPKPQRPAAAAPAKPAAPLDAAARRRLAQRKQAERNRA